MLQKVFYLPDNVKFEEHHSKQSVQYIVIRGSQASLVDRFPASHNTPNLKFEEIYSVIIIFVHSTTKKPKAK